MLAGEDLPHLLQTLLVGVEHAICRIPLDELTFPASSSPTVSNASSDQNVIEYAADFSMDDRNAASKRAECNLKRRELITKNNSTNKKYAIKRITFNGSSSKQTPNESETRDEETIEQEAIELTTSAIASQQNLTNETDALTSGDAVASTLPLFCLGGSFPHIDSDEESGDDGKKIQTGECNRTNSVAEIWELSQWKFRFPIRIHFSKSISIENVLRTFMTDWLWCWPTKLTAHALSRLLCGHSKRIQDLARR